MEVFLSLEKVKMVKEYLNGEIGIRHKHQKIHTYINYNPLGKIK